MTRMAPRPGSYARATPASVGYPLGTSSKESQPTDPSTRPAASEGELRWRIGRLGSLCLKVVTPHDGALCPHRPADSPRPPLSNPSARVIITIRSPQVGKRSESWRAPSETCDRSFEGRAFLAQTGGETVLELVWPSKEGDRRASVVLVLRERAGSILALTDLPAALGLRGGTYALAESSLRPFAEFVQLCLAEPPRSAG